MTTEQKSELIDIADAAALLVGEYDEVDADNRAAVLAKIIERGDDAPDGLIRSLPVRVRAWDDGSSEETETDYSDDKDDYAAAAEELWDGADYGSGDYRVTVSWEATDAAGNEVGSGSFDIEGHTEEPVCPESDEHEWTSEFEGGCTENPGVWSTGGTSMSFHAHCRHCGIHRIEHTTGPQHNPGECDRTTYSEPDAEWVAAHLGDTDDHDAARE